jgi:two-component system OmpR family sensor kinase
MTVSLWQKLLLAFALVIVLGGAVQAILVNQATQGRFDEFVNRSGQAYAQELAPTLAAYYDVNNGWAVAQDENPSVTTAPATASPMPTVAVETSIATLAATVGSMGRMRGEMHDTEMHAGADNEDAANAQDVQSSTPDALARHGMMGSHMADAQMIGNSVWTHMGVRFVLTDDQGAIIADTGAPADAAAGETQPANPVELTSGTPVTVAGHTVGTLYALNDVGEPASLASDFLVAVQRSVWLASGAAGIVALLLGLTLFRQIVSPIRQVTVAAQAMAAGKLEQQVVVKSRDEVGQLASAFNQMASALVQQQQLRRNLIADVAHELRTPLSVIQGNLEAMLDGVLPVDKEELASLHEETSLLTRLVGDLRLLSLAEAGQLTLDRNPMGVEGLLQRAVEPLRRQAELANVTLIVQAEPELPLVLVDGDRISQVLGNLLQNALRYTGPSGQVSVSARGANIGNKREVVVSVVDTGAGIAAEDLPHVFDRFYRGDKSRSRETGGTGIGLALAKQLVEAHGGRIWVESVEGQGAMFSFTLPPM